MKDYIITLTVLILYISTDIEAFTTLNIKGRSMPLLKSSRSNEEERKRMLSDQKQEAANSFISYNDGRLKGKATVLDVDMIMDSRDIIGLPSITSAEYVLSGETEIGGDGIQQFNTLQWKNGDEGGVSFSRYTTKLSDPMGGFDVDAVDGR